jgi:hypothetical protein
MRVSVAIKTRSRHDLLTVGTVHNLLHFTFVPDANEPQKGTLFWEFAYVVVNQCIEAPSRNDLVNVVNILAPEFAEFA